MNKHTPGPWKVIPGSRDIVSCGDILKRRFIAEALESTIKSEHQPSVFVATDLEVAANARLIAAAPEMADHISLMIRTIFDTLRHGLTDGQIDSLESVCKEANAILAKAEGR